MKKIVLIVPYFGEFPNYFALFLKSCEYNKTIDWIFFSDIKTDIKYPDNVNVIEISFEELKHKIQEKFTFPITLDSPYKLCDYKPAYGYIFEEFIGDYDFWGYCDIDLLFGDLRKFLTNELLNSYDKIGYLGHFSLYKNTKKLRMAFEENICNTARYKEVFATAHNCIFDEWDYPSINHLLLCNGYKIKYWDDFFDIYPHDDQMKRVVQKIVNMKPERRKEIICRQPMVATIEDGHAYCIKKQEGLLTKEEVAYIHFQKRNMEINIFQNETNILCVPNQFLPLDSSQAKREIELALQRKIVNKKRIKKIYIDSRYRLIEKTGPIRHKVRSLFKKA